MTCALRIDLPGMTSVSLQRRAKARYLHIFRLTIVLFLVHIACVAQRDIPALEGRRLHDEAAVLSPNAINALEQQLKAFEDSTSNQIAILVVSSLQGEEPEQYAMRVAKEWKLGTSQNDNGILILVAVDDHKMRIEVGQGLEGALPDVLCGRIIRNEMAPNFRRGDYDTGLFAAVTAILQAIKGEYHADNSGGSGEGNPAIPFLFVFGILAIFTFKALFTAGCAGWGNRTARRRRRRPGDDRAIAFPFLKRIMRIGQMAARLVGE